MKYSNSYTIVQLNRKTLLLPCVAIVALVVVAFGVISQLVHLQVSIQLMDGAVVAGVLLLAVAAWRKQSYGVVYVSPTQGLATKLFQRPGRDHPVYEFTDDQLALLQGELLAMPEDDIPPALLARYQR